MHGGNPPTSIDIGTTLGAAGSVQQQKHLIGQWLDKDRATALAFWQHVHARGGLAIGDWKFVADAAQTTSVLQDDALYSVREYNERMRATSGRFFLGMDGLEHRRDAKMGAIIPSWNTFNPPGPVDRSALEAVRQTAADVTRALLSKLAERTELARLTYDRAECQMKSVELMGPVLDACAARFFGVPGHSAFSLILWAKDITWLHFRVQADKAVDLSPAEHASGQFRQHVLSLIAALDAPNAPDNPPLRRSVAGLRKVLGPDARDEDVARNLIGVMTGSLTAVYKAFLDALLLQPCQPGDERIVWPELQPMAATVPSACPHHAAAALPSFPYYDATIAAPLAHAKRGSLDVIYRTYEGRAEIKLGELSIEPGDVVIVWLGGTLDAHTPDNLFGIGVHKCPGMDMGKAMLDGVMSVLTRVRGPDAPRRRVVEGDLALVFGQVDVLRL